MQRNSILRRKKWPDREKLHCGGVCPYHASCAPDVCWGSVLSPYEHLQGAVLTCLNVLCEVLVLEEKAREGHIVRV